MLYRVIGTDPETNSAVTVELGWVDGGYFYGVDSRAGDEITSGVEIATLPELVNATRGYVRWDRQLYYALRDAPVEQYRRDHPGDPVTCILEAVR